MRKRIWAVLLAACLTVGLLPAVTLADSGWADAYGEGFLEILDNSGNSTIVLLSEEKAGEGWSYKSLTLTLTNCNLQRIHFHPYQKETSNLTIAMSGTNNVSSAEGSGIVGGILNDGCVVVGGEAGNFIFTGGGTLTTELLQISPIGGDKKASARVQSGTVTVKTTGYMDGGTLTVEQGAVMDITGNFPKIHCTVAGELKVTATAGNNLYWQKSGVDSHYDTSRDGVIVACGGLRTNNDSGLLSHYSVTNGSGQPCVLSTDGATVVLDTSDDTAVDPVYIRTKAGHSWTATTEPATCTEDGKKIYTCAGCPGETWEETIRARGHSYQQNVTKEPTATTEGEVTITCSGCDYHETQVLPVTGEKTITVIASENGSVSCACKTAYPGTPVTITVAPSSGYQGGVPVVKNASGGIISVSQTGPSTYTFTMSDQNVTIEGVFTKTGTVGVNGGYTAFADRNNRMADGYITIEFGSTGLGEVKANSAYLVQIVNGGQSILFIAHSDNTSLRFLCNKVGKLSVWEVPDGASINIEDLTLTTIQGKQVITNEDIAALPAYTGN